MRDKKRGHNHRRQDGLKGFETHSSRGPSRLSDSRVRRGRAWSFFGGGSVAAYSFEPHFRHTSRTHALSGKHIRRVEEPVRATHGKGNA